MPPRVRVLSSTPRSKARPGGGTPGCEPGRSTSTNCTLMPLRVRDGPHATAALRVRGGQTGTTSQHFSLTGPDAVSYLPGWPQRHRMPMRPLLPRVARSCRWAEVAVRQDRCMDVRSTERDDHQVASAEVG